MTPFALTLLQTSGTPIAIAKKALAEQKAAFVAKDASRVAKGFTSDFTYVDKQGRVAKRDASVQSFRYSLSTYQRIRKYEVTVVNARRTKEGVVVVADTFFDVDLTMNNKKGRLTSWARNESLLVPKGAVWLFRRIRVLDSKMTLPGSSMLDAPSG